MSGIAGIFYRDGRSVSHAVLEKMLSRIGHRGPDGRGIWCMGSVGLAQCMHRSTPESVRERQPYLSQQADLILVADARIDNRESLIRALALKGRPKEEITDAQLILNAYRTWGEICPDQLEGDFAFAIYDSQQQTIFCARDTAGVRPFYYHLSRNFMAFASEIKALKDCPEVPKKLNETKVAEYLLWMFEDTRNTFYQDIFRLPPASSLTVSVERERVRQYWSLDPTKELRYQDADDYVSNFQALFNQAVQQRTRSAYPIGSTLSGGLDSSSIASTAIKYLPNANSAKLNVFSAIFPDLDSYDRKEVDERAYIDAVLETRAYEPIFINASFLSPFIDQNVLPHILDEPYLAPTLFLFWGVYRAAQETGVRVLLDGTDGDRTVSNGYALLSDLAWSLKWYRLWQEAVAINSEEKTIPRVLRTIWGFGIRPLIPSGIINLKRRMFTDRRYESVNTSLINPEFARREGFTGRLASRRPSDIKRPYSSRHKHMRELSSGINALSLEMFDKAAAFHRVELRYPFYDRRLIEFCLALPADQKLNRGKTRYILRAAMHGVLPAQVQFRTTKSNLALAFSRNLSGIDRHILYKMVYRTNETLGAYIDRAAVNEAYRRYITNPTVHINDAYMLFGAIMLAEWLIAAGYD